MAANGGPHGTPHENGDGGGKHKRGSHKRGNSLSEGMSRLFFGLRGLHGGGGGASGGAGGSSEERAPTSTQQISSSSKAAKKAKRGRSQSSKDRTSSSPSSSPSSSSRDKIKKRSGGSSAPTWDRIEQPASQPPSHHQVRAALTPSGSQREPAVWRSSSGGDLAERWSVRRGEREAATATATDHSREQPAASASSSSSSFATTAAAITAGLQLSLQPAANGTTTTSGAATPPALSPRERKEFIGRARTAATPPHPSATQHREPSQQTQKRRQQLQLQLQIQQQQQEGLDETGPRSWKATTPLHSPLSGPSEDEHPAWGGGSGATSGSEAEEKRFAGTKLGSEPESGSETEHMAAIGGMSSPTTASYTSSSSSSSTTTTSSSSSSAASTGMERVRLTKRTVQDFEFGKVLGEGSYGQVRAARDIATGLLLAIKILDKRHVVKENKVEQVKREKQILESLSHPNIIHLYGTFQDNNSLFFAMEYCPNGELHQHLKRLGSFNLECTQFYIAELVSALEYLHSQGIVHRDIKPENMLLGANFHLKLIDFGTAKSVGPDQYARSTSFVGTAEYVPPELLNEHYSVKSCVLYQFLAGKSPFRGANDYKTFRKIKKLKIKFPTDFAHLKAHRFFEGIDWDTLHTTTPPVLAAPAVPVFVDEEKERKFKAQQAKSSVWGKFLFKNSDEVIIQTDRVAKISKHFFGATKSPKKRQLILTDFPRLFYVDIDRMAQAGEIEWRSDLRVEARHDNIFEITSGEKTYIFEFEAEGRAAKWCAAISRLQRRNNGEEEEDEDDAGDDENDFATEDEVNDRAHPHDPPVMVVDHPMTARDENREKDK
ncbi:serine/threonineprotein kinase [Acanthamoeba castellanii str. Neff]|uniref:non-specific serine/threonine protein kinase n=1 Tax=Acanthamoeba castellanii (strain ATCC 30010 / Neff) TaxID=1257118 RepID=L8GXP5_ACACF|nr:serine/threonineprotein kinase [Acanthamoeba castellanii str. Neff]ELR17338.1 serine/threonineprotein kinase [Acanthamoeba castellanii str. Neff]